ncbi:MAG: DsrE family protein [Ferrimicrobium sp.]
MNAENKSPQVVIHLNTSDPEIWVATINTITNLLVEDEHADIEVVLQGRGVDLVRTAATHLSVPLLGLAAKGVSFVVCNNSLIQRQLREEDLLPFATIVPSAIGELIRAQNDGRAYYKP